MATRLGNDAAWIGTAQADTEPDRPIVEDKLEAALSDQAHVYQVIKGKNLTGGALSTITAHTHNGTVGAALSLPLACFGMRGWSEAADSLTSGAPPQVLLDEITAINYTTLLRWPVFSPPGVTSVVATLVCSAELADAGVLLNGTPPGSSSRWGAGYATLEWTKTVTANAVTAFVLCLSAATEARGVGRIISLSVMPRAWRAVRSSEPDPGVATRSGAAAQSLVASSFEPVWDTFTAASRPLSSWVTARAGRNVGYTKELLTGQPADGVDTATTGGHDHDGADSASISMPLYSSAFGAAKSTDAGGDDDGPASTQMRNLVAPHLGSTTSSKTFKTVALAAVAVPRGVSTVKWTAYAYDRDGHGVDFTIYSGTTINSTTNSDSASVVTGPGFVAQSGASLTVSPGVVNFFRVDMQRDTSTGDIFATGLEIHT